MNDPFLDDPRAYAPEGKTKVQSAPDAASVLAELDAYAKEANSQPEPPEPEADHPAAIVDESGFPKVRQFGSRQYVDPDESASNLLGKGALERGGQGVIVSQSGVGKSSFGIGLAASLAAGVPYLEMLRPGRYYADKGLRVLYLQAENSDNKTARAEEGVSEVWEHGQPALKRVSRNLSVLTIDTVSGAGFVEALEHYLNTGRYDLIIGDPFFAYYGGDVSAQKEMSPFLRNMVQPVIARHGVGLIWIHHTNKPRKGDGDSKPSDSAYAGSGSAELTNVARIGIVIEPTKERGVFLIRGAKNGGELDMRGDDGNLVYEFYAAYYGSGKYAWRPATETEIEAAQSHSGTGRPQTVTDDDLVLRYDAMFPQGAESVREAARQMTPFIELSESRIRTRLTELKQMDRIRLNIPSHPAEVD